jgi:tetrahydromethanopterin S-methyltransferase subunit F
MILAREGLMPKTEAIDTMVDDILSSCNF